MLLFLSFPCIINSATVSYNCALCDEYVIWSCCNEEMCMWQYLKITLLKDDIARSCDSNCKSSIWLAYKILTVTAQLIWLNWTDRVPCIKDDRNEGKTMQVYHKWDKWCHTMKWTCIDRWDRMRSIIDILHPVNT